MPAIPHPHELLEFPYPQVTIGCVERSMFMGRRSLTHHSSDGWPLFCNFHAVVNIFGPFLMARTRLKVAHFWIGLESSG